MLGPINVGDDGNQEKEILFLDFEGFESSSVSHQNTNSTESKLFALCALLSSTICFNVSKTLSASTLEDLDFLKDLHRRIQIKPAALAENFMRETTGANGRGSIAADRQIYQEHLFPQLMPRLLWVVRDSKIEMKDKHGEWMSENQFMELTLSQIAKNPKRAIARTRDKILNSFPDRELVTIRHPLGVDGQDAEIDYDLMQAGIEDLSEEFKSDVLFLRDKLLESTPVKQIWTRSGKPGGFAMDENGSKTGKTLAFLLNEYVQALNDKGSVIQFDQAWDFYLESELDDIYNKCAIRAQNQVRDILRSTQEAQGTKSTNGEVDEKMCLPMFKQDVLFLFDQMRTELMKEFNSLLKKANTKTEKEAIGRKMVQLEQEILAQLRPVEQKNKTASQMHLQELDQEKFKEVLAKIKKGNNSVVEE